MLVNRVSACSRSADALGDAQEHPSESHRDGLAHQALRRPRRHHRARRRLSRRAGPRARVRRALGDLARLSAGLEGRSRHGRARLVPLRLALRGARAEPQMNAAFLFALLFAVPQIHATRTSSAPEVDGVLDEPCWTRADAATTFTQKFP